MVNSALEELPPAQSTHQFLTRLEVTRLFGYKPVTVDFFAPSEDGSNNINIIYGNNGGGKTTILNIIYHVLSSDVGKGHRSWMAKLPFSKLILRFSDGSSVDVRKNKGLFGSFVVHITRDGVTRSFKCVANEDNIVKRTSYENESDELAAELSTFSFELFYITDERKYLTTSQDIIRSRRISRSRVIEYTEGGRVITEREDEEESLKANVIANVVLDTFRREVSRSGGLSLQRSTNSIYLDLVRRISGGVETITPSDQRASLISRLRNTHASMRDAVKLGAMSDFEVEVYLRIVGSAPKNSISQIALVLEPFLDSLVARLNITAPAVQRMTAFLTELNRLYGDKEFRFSAGTGFSIFSSKIEGPISLDWLSSGEKQLFIILSSVFLAQNTTGIIMIDEPELSLNVLWQREFVRVLHKMSRAAPVQYILASHSPEILNSEAVHEIGVDV